jgi:hypothetical protein
MTAQTKIGNSPFASALLLNINLTLSPLNCLRVSHRVSLDNNDGNVVGTSRSIYETPVVGSRVRSMLTLLRIDNHTIVIDEYFNVGSWLIKTDF